MSLQCIERMLKKCEASVAAAGVLMDANNGDTEGLCKRRRKASIRKHRVNEAWKATDDAAPGTDKTL